MTLGIVALVEIAIGLRLYLRTGPQVAGLLALLESDAPRMLSEEGARMIRVQRNFVIAQYIELVVVVIAAIIALWQKSRFWISGLALGLLLHGAILLAFDVIAERRGAIYLSALNTRSNHLAGD